MFPENEIYSSLEYSYDKYYIFYGKLYSYTTLFSLQWISDIDSKCLTITYIHRFMSKLDILMSIFNENNKLITSLNLEKDVSLIYLILNSDLSINRCICFSKKRTMT